MENQQDMGVAGTSMEPKADPYMYNTDYHRFADYVGVDVHRRKNTQVAEKLSFIYDWAKEQVGRDDRETIMRALNSYQKGLGDTSTGETLLNRLYRDIRLGAKPAKPAPAQPKPEVKVEAKKASGFDIQKTVEAQMKPMLKSIESEVMKGVELEVKKRVEQSIQESISKALKNISLK